MKAYYDLNSHAIFTRFEDHKSSKNCMRLNMICKIIYYKICLTDFLTISTE